MDQTSNEVTPILQFGQSHAAVNSLLLKQGSPPQNIAVFFDAAEQDTVRNCANQIGSI